MDVLNEIVRNLLVIIILSSFMELLLPEGQMKPFVRFSIGLFVIIAVLSPALGYLYDDRDFQVEFWNYKVEERLEQEILEKGESIQKDMGSKSSSLVQEKVQGQINAVAMLVPGVDDVHTEVLAGPDGRIQAVKLTVRAKGEGVEPVNQVNVFSGIASDEKQMNHEEIQHKILQVLKNLYGIEADNINVQFEGGNNHAG